MKTGKPFLLSVVFLGIVLIPIDLTYTSKLSTRFKELENQRIAISNQLATAKIVSENLAHVRELVFRNMDFPGNQSSAIQQSTMFQFLTESVNDLKMKLISVRPSRPVTEGRVTSYGYDIELEGDFFSLGELCAKLENSQRVIAISSIEVNRNRQESSTDPKTRENGNFRKSVSIKFRLDTFRVTKG